MVQKQLDSKLTWLNFESNACPKRDRARLQRLNPPIGGNRVELYDWTEMDLLEKLARTWCAETESSRIDKIVDTLIGTLFFFEPHDNGEPHESSRQPAHFDRLTLSGSIRCRLRHQSPEVERLLAKVESFWHAHVPSADPVTALAAPNWTLVGSAMGEKKVVPAEMLVEENDMRKFRVPCVLSARKGTHRFEVLAVKLKERPDKVLLSGFPSNLSTMAERSRQIWLQ
jgi:hypothetical protein